MRAVLQRVTQAAVVVDDETRANIGLGWLVLLGISADDKEADLDYTVDKILNLRAFSDTEGKFNLCLGEVGGSVLIVSQFTLYGDCRKGRRPGFTAAAPAALARQLYEDFMKKLREATPLLVKEGVFQAHMQVSLCNDGPVTLLIDSKKEF